MRMLNRKWTELYSSRYSNLLERDPPGVTYLASRSDVKYIAMLGDQLRNSTTTPRKFLWMNDKLVSQVRASTGSCLDVCFEVFFPRAEQRMGGGA